MEIDGKIEILSVDNLMKIWFTSLIFLPSPMVPLENPIEWLLEFRTICNYTHSFMDNFSTVDYFP